MYADVVVFTPTDPAKNYFTYQVPKKLSKYTTIGLLVSVPWGKKITNGIVIEIKDKTEVTKPKLIKKILSPTPILLPNYIKLLKWMSWYYHAPMLNCLKTMLPTTPERLIKACSTAVVSKPPSSLQQTLVLVPNINLIPQVLASLKSKSARFVIYHSELTVKKRLEAWIKIWNGQAGIIVGCRSAIFAPCQNLSQVIIKNAHDTAYKDQRSPYYHSQTVAFELAQIAGCKLILESQTPRVETVFGLLGHKVLRLNGKKVLNKNNITLNFPTAQQPYHPTTYIVDMNSERKAGNFSPISNLLKENLLKVTRSGGSTLLFLNRKTEAGQVICNDCKFAGYSLTSPELCPKCQSPKIRFLSLNLNTVAAEVESILPKAQINFVTQESKQSAVSSQRPTVTLGTTAILYSLHLTSYSLVAVISADTMFNIPDFAASEKTFFIIWHLSNLIANGGTLLIQTLNPEHYAITCAVEKNYSKFYQTEIDHRKVLGYPPFSTLAKLTHSAKKEQKAANEAQKLYNRQITAHLPGVTVLGPTPAYADPNLLGKSKYHIICKAKTRDKLEPALNLVPANWKINIDPADSV